MKNISLENINLIGNQYVGSVVGEADRGRYFNITSTINITANTGTSTA